MWTELHVLVIRNITIVTKCVSPFMFVSDSNNGSYCMIDILSPWINAYLAVCNLVLYIMRFIEKTNYVYRVVRETWELYLACCTQIAKMKGNYGMLLVECIPCQRVDCLNVGIKYSPLNPVLLVAYSWMLVKLNLNWKTLFNPFTPNSGFIDFTLSNARRFLLVQGRPLGSERVKKLSPLTLSLPRMTL